MRNCFVDVSRFYISEFVLMDFKHKEALVSISCIVTHMIQASAELIKQIMILEDLGLLSVFSREALPVMTGWCCGIKSTLATQIA